MSTPDSLVITGLKVLLRCDSSLVFCVSVCTRSAWGRVISGGQPPGSQLAWWASARCQPMGLMESRAGAKVRGTTEGWWGGETERVNSKRHGL